MRWFASLKGILITFVALVAFVFIVGAAPKSQVAVPPIPVHATDATSTGATATSTPTMAAQAATTTTKLAGTSTTAAAASAAPALALSNVAAPLHSALVNVLCVGVVGGKSRIMSGTGVFIDPKGYILTNAHVGLYFLLA